MNSRPAARPNPNEKSVRVFDTEQESEALVVHGLLESSGIDSDVTSLDAQQDILPGVGGTIILVREGDADVARRVIEDTVGRQPATRPQKSISPEIWRTRTNRFAVQAEGDCPVEIGPVGLDVGFREPGQNIPSGVAITVAGSH